MTNLNNDGFANPGVLSGERVSRSAAVPATPGFDAALWQRIETMRIDPEGAATTFMDRLREYNTWSVDVAAKVDSEYRRFLYLAARAGHPVTPSTMVDQAWHLHLIYTRHYWDELCPNVLGQQLHHEPSAGGSHEKRKFDGQYERTLASYRQAFGDAPPADIWPHAEPHTLASTTPWLALVAVLAVLMLVGVSGWILMLTVVGGGVVAAAVSAHAVQPERSNQRKCGGGCGAAGSGGHLAAGGSCGGSAGGGCGGGCGGCGG